MMKYLFLSVLMVVVSVFLVNSNPNPNTKSANKGVVRVTQCTSGDEAGSNIPVNVIVPKCEAPPCVLKSGENYTVEINFAVPQNTETLRVQVGGIIDGLELPWNGVEVDGCKDITFGSCPLRQGYFWTYGVTVYVEPFYPRTELIIKWQMRDDMGRVVWCFHLPAEIVA